MLDYIKRKLKAHPLLTQWITPFHREYLIRMSTRPVKSPLPDPLANPILVQKFDGYDAYARWATANAALLAQQEQAERATHPAVPKTFSTPGTCAICARETEFTSNYDYAIQDAQHRIVPNLREHLTCAHCGLRNRVRAALHLFIQEFRPRPDQSIYITEQFGSTFRWLAGHFPHLQGSEYQPDKGPLGTTIRGIRNEDIAQLSWPGDKFDFILSLEVLEHVPEVEPCFVEVYRCLRPGGRFLFTTPTYLNRKETTIRAKLEHGQVTHLLEPEYHGGNLMDPSKGTLCYRYFGWDILDQLKCAGFTQAEIWVYWSRELGYMGGSQVAITATKE